MKETHDFWTDRMSAHLDGDLAEGEARAMDAHLEACPACRQLRKELARIRDQAGILPGMLPDRDLWPAIEARLGEDPGEEKVIPLRPREGTPQPASQRGPVRVALSRLQAVAAALVLLAGGWMAGTVRSPEARVQEQVAPDPALVAVADQVPGVPASLSGRLATLERTVRGRLDQLEPGTRETLLRNLEVIDRAIRESLDALSQEPGSDYLRAHLGAALERKHGYLERMAALLEA